MSAEPQGLLTVKAGGRAVEASFGNLLAAGFGCVLTCALSKRESKRVRTFAGAGFLVRSRAGKARMFEMEAFILAGGASSRRGSDKARLRLGEQTFVERIAGALAPVALKVSVVSSRPDAGAWNMAVVPDVYAGCGTLGGLHAALFHSRSGWTAVVSCDLPFVTAELFRRLASFVRDGVDAVAPLQADGFLQPLCALYAREKCLEMAEDLLRSGELRPRELLRRVCARLVLFEELSELEASAHFFSNVNTPEDYARASAEAEKLGM